MTSTFGYAEDVPHDNDTALHKPHIVSTARNSIPFSGPHPERQLPFQLNYDRGYGKNGEGRRFTGKAQPVIPIKLSEKYVYYVRTVISFEQKRTSDGDGYDVDGFGAPLIKTFLSNTVVERNEFRIDPFISPAALSGSLFGTQRTGCGVSWLGSMRPDDWAIRMFGYQSFAIGGSDAGAPLRVPTCNRSSQSAVGPTLPVRRTARQVLEASCRSFVLPRWS